MPVNARRVEEGLRRRAEARERIARLSEEDASANRIIKQLRAEGLGYRRKEMLKDIRAYRASRPLKPEAVPVAPTEERKKHLKVAVAIYGTVKGSNKRIEIASTNKKLLGEAVALAIRHPPRERFPTVTAKELYEHPSKYLNMGIGWDDRPDFDCIEEVSEIEE